MQPPDYSCSIEKGVADFIIGVARNRPRHHECGKRGVWPVNGDWHAFFASQDSDLGGGPVKEAGPRRFRDRRHAIGRFHKFADKLGCRLHVPTPMDVTGRTRKAESCFAGCDLLGVKSEAGSGIPKCMGIRTALSKGHYFGLILIGSWTMCFPFGQFVLPPRSARDRPYETPARTLLPFPQHAQPIENPAR